MSNEPIEDLEYPNPEHVKGGIPATEVLLEKAEGKLPSKVSSELPEGPYGP